MKQDSHYDQFVRLLTSEQLGLHRYLNSLLGDFDAASTVLQEANIVLLDKFEEFELNTNFSAWARKIAYWQALAFLRDQARDKLVFSVEMVNQLANRPAIREEESEARLALRHCLNELSENSLELIRHRYNADLSIRLLAKKLGKNQSAVKVSLHRIRRSLLGCIERQLATHA